MSESRRIEAVILDIDGTLLDSNAAHARAFLDAADEVGLAHPGFERLLSLIGMGGDKLIPTAFGVEADSERGRAVDERKGEIFRTRYASGLLPTPGARALVQHFAERGLRRIVATSADGDDLQLLLEKAGVADLIDACATSSDVDASKPDPDIVEAALSLAGRPADRTLMLGDTPYDVEAATGAGVAIVAVRTGGWDDASLRGALAIYDAPDDLLARYAESPFG